MAGDKDQELLRKFTIATKPYPDLYALLAVHYADHPSFGIKPIEQLIALIEQDTAGVEGEK